jgi:hypothetical protein
MCPSRPKQRSRLLVAVSSDPTGVTSRTVNLHSRVACSSYKIRPAYIDFAPSPFIMKTKISKPLCAGLQQEVAGQIGFEKCIKSLLCRALYAKRGMTRRP